MDTTPSPKNGSKKWIFIGLVLVLIVGSGAFYWFSLRPTQIRAYCQRQVNIAYQKEVDLGGGYKTVDGKWTIRPLTESEKRKVWDRVNNTDFIPCLRLRGL